MNIRTAVFAMIAMMLSAGPLMAMDSEYLEKRRKSLYEESTSSVTQDERFEGKSGERDMSLRGDSQHGVSDEQKFTQDSLRYWWL